MNSLQESNLKINPAKDSVTNYNISLIRAFAILAVVLNHVCNWCQFYNGNFEIRSIYMSLATIGVPLFVMVSGALLLKKTDEPVGQFFKKRVRKILIPFLVWSYVYLLWQKIIPLLPWQRTYAPEQVSFNPINLLKTPAYPHLWFMYMLIALYIAIPILRGILNNQSEQLCKYVFFLLLALSLLSFIKELFGFSLSQNFELNFFSTCTVYLFFGYYSMNPPCKKLTLEKSLLLSMLGFIVTFGLSYIWRPTATVFQNIIAPSVMLTAIGVYNVLLNIKLSEKCKHFIKSVSDCSFGIYFLHFIPLYFIATITVNGKNIFMIFHSVLSIPIALLICFFVSYTVILVIRHIPLLNKII